MRLFVFICFLYLLVGCASVKNYFGQNKSPESVVAESVDMPIKYSESSQLPTATSRQYKRMTKSRMEEESELQSQAGSMWVNEGQTSYLFVQNKARREGDVLNITLAAPALRQIETKVSVIKKLLKQLDDDLQKTQDKNLENNQAPAQKLADSAEAKRAPAATTPEKKKEEKEDLTDIQNISSRLVERMADGNYRIKGQQPFMIGKREYRVIVTGLLRPEDFNDEGIESSKLLDPQYDVVSVRRKTSYEN
jgi:flagellar L-ring protein FlgH